MIYLPLRVYRVYSCEFFQFHKLTTNFVVAWTKFQLLSRKIGCVTVDIHFVKESSIYNNKFLSVGAVKIRALFAISRVHSIGGNELLKIAVGRVDSMVKSPHNLPIMLLPSHWVTVAGHQDYWFCSPRWGESNRAFRSHGIGCHAEIFDTQVDGVSCHVLGNGDACISRPSEMIISSWIQTMQFCIRNPMN